MLLANVRPMNRPSSLMRLARSTTSRSPRGRERRRASAATSPAPRSALVRHHIEQRAFSSGQPRRLEQVADITIGPHVVEIVGDSAGSRPMLATRCAAKMMLKGICLGDVAPGRENLPGHPSAAFFCMRRKVHWHQARWCRPSAFHAGRIALIRGARALQGRADASRASSGTRPRNDVPATHPGATVIAGERYVARATRPSSTRKSSRSAHRGSGSARNGRNGVSSRDESFGKTRQTLPRLRWRKTRQRLLGAPSDRITTIGNGLREAIGGELCKGERFAVNHEDACWQPRQTLKFRWGG